MKIVNEKRRFLWAVAVVWIAWTVAAAVGLAVTDGGGDAVVYFLGLSVLSLLGAVTLSECMSSVVQWMAETAKSQGHSDNALAASLKALLWGAAKLGALGLMIYYLLENRAPSRASVFFGVGTYPLLFLAAAAIWSRKLSAKRRSGRKKR